MEQPDALDADAHVIAGLGDVQAEVGPLPSVSVWWAAAGWMVAGVLGAAASLFMVMSRQDPYVGSSSSGAGDVTVYSATESFDAWGRGSLVRSPTTGSATSGTGASVLDAAGGPSYGIVLCAAAVLLLVAAISIALPGRVRLPNLLQGLGPVGAGALAGVAACQFLSFFAASRPFTVAGLPAPIGSSSTWQLGACPWITLAAAVVAVTTWFLAQYSNARRVSLTAAQPPSTGPMQPAPGDPTGQAPLDALGLPPLKRASRDPEPRLAERPADLQDPPPAGDALAAFRRPQQQRDGPHEML